MSITVEEKARGRSGDVFSREISYRCTESSGQIDDSAALVAATNASPEEWDGLLRQNAVIADTNMPHDVLMVSIAYGETPKGTSTIPQEVGSVEYAFNYQAESEHVYLSLGTRAYGRAGDAPFDFQGAINVTKDNIVEGLDLPAGTPTNEWNFTAAATGVTDSYEALVENMMGCVNNVAFKGRPAGSLRFVQCNSQTSPTNKVLIRFGFQYSPNETNIQVGKLLDGSAPITVAAKGGHELIWGYFDNKVFNDRGVVKYPRWVYVETVYRTANFNQLGF